MTQAVEPGPAGRLRGVVRALAGARGRLLVGLWVPLAVALQGMWRMREYTVDDAYISFRYARNFAEGNGLVYNVGEQVEGYTNFLWTVILAMGIKVGFDPVMFSKVLGVLFACGTLLLTYRLADRIHPVGAVPCVATWLLATTPVFTGHAVFGLETPLFAFLIVLGVWLFREEEQADRRWPFSGLVFALAALTRPEAPLFVGVLVLMLPGPALLPVKRLRALAPVTARFSSEVDVRATGMALGLGLVAAGAAYARRDHPELIEFETWPATLLIVGLALVVVTLPRAMISRRNIVRGEFFVIPVAVHLLWRFKFYGQWVPNTLVAKTGNPVAQFRDGWGYFGEYLGHEGPVLWLMFAGVGYAVARRERVLLALAPALGLFAVYVVSVGGDWMALSRFFAPVQPFAFILVGVGVRALWAERSLVVMIALAAATPFVIDDRMDAIDDGREAIELRKRDWGKRAESSKWFAVREQRYGAELTRGTIAIGDMGRIGWDTGYPILDLLGLVDPVISRLPGGYTRKVGPGYRDHFFEVAPRYLVLISGRDRCTAPLMPAYKSLYRDPRFRDRYGLSGRVRTQPGVFWCIYEHVDEIARFKQATRPHASPD